MQFLLIENSQRTDDQGGGLLIFRKLFPSEYSGLPTRTILFHAVFLSLCPDYNMVYRLFQDTCIRTREIQEKYKRNKEEDSEMDTHK